MQIYNVIDLYALLGMMARTQQIWQEADRMAEKVGYNHGATWREVRSAAEFNLKLGEADIRDFTGDKTYHFPRAQGRK